MMAEEVKLLMKFSSPYALRIVWALKLKGVQYDSIEEDLSNKSPLLLQSNPVYKKVPVLIHNGKSISESMIILEYVDETWKEYPLLPEDPHERAVVRFWAKFAEDKVFRSIIWGVFITKGKEQEEALVQANENLKYLEDELKGKKFFGGEKIGILDLMLGWLTNLICVMEEIICMKIIDNEKFPLLSAWMQEFGEVPLIKESLPPHDKMLTIFWDMRVRYLAAAQSK